MGKSSLFISYSHADAQWAERVATHLGPLGGSLVTWDDRRIGAGEDWRAELERAIDGASVAVLLISAHFLGSRFIAEVEIPRLLRRRDEVGLHLVPVLVSPCDWEAVDWLARLQLRPPGARALSEHTGPEADAALAAISREVRLLVSGQARRTAEKSLPPLSPADVSISRLPVTGEHLFGRERELALLDAAWTDPDTHVISLVAPGGVGKSNLVNHWLGKLSRGGYGSARRVLGWSFFSQGTRDTAATSDTFVSWALRHLGDSLPHEGSAYERGERLARLLQRERTLLILDGLEPLQAPPGPAGGRLRDPALATLVRELAFVNPGLCLITSRIAVTDIEHFRDTTAPTLELDRLSDVAGAELLRALGVHGTDEELRHASQELHGNALGVSLLGTYLRDTCGGDVRRRSELHSLAEITGEEGQAEQVLRSYEHWLGEGPELAVLRLLGLFDRPAAREWLGVLRAPPAIPGLTEHLVNVSEPRWNQALSRLRRAGLLAKADPVEPDALDTHPLIREYFARRLRAQAPEAWRSGHDRLYAHFRGIVLPRPQTPEEKMTLYLAIAHGCQAGHHEEVFQQLYPRRATGNVGDWRSALTLEHMGTELEALACFFDPPWKIAPTLSEPSRVHLQLATAIHLSVMGRMPELIEPMREALRICLAHGNHEWASAALDYLAMVQTLLGDLPAAQQSAEQSLELARTLDTPDASSLAALMLAHVLLQRGQFAAVEALSRPFGASPPGTFTGGRDPVFYELIYNAMLIDQGRHPEALRRVEELMTSFRLSIPLSIPAEGHIMFGACKAMIHLRQGAPSPEADLEALSTALALTRRTGTPFFTSILLTDRGEAYLRLRDFDRARKDFEEALFISTGGRMVLIQADIHLGLCRLYLAMEEPARARTELKLARRIIERTGYRRRDQAVLELEARLAAAPGDTTEQPSSAP